MHHAPNAAGACMPCKLMYITYSVHVASRVEWCKSIYAWFVFLTSYDTNTKIRQLSFWNYTSYYTPYLHFLPTPSLSTRLEQHLLLWYVVFLTDLWIKSVYGLLVKKYCGLHDSLHLCFFCVPIAQSAYWEQTSPLRIALNMDMTW